MNIPKDLTREIKTRLKSIEGQLRGILNMLETDKNPEQILIQFKAAQKGLDKAHFLLLDEVFRKALAIKISQVVDSCPGNCGNEEKIKYIYQQFPDLQLDELTEKIQEISEIEKRLATYKANVIEEEKKE